MSENEEVRRQFEAWARGIRLYKMAREESDPQCYEDPMTQGAWEGYQAALRSPAVVALVEAADDMLCPSYRGPDQDNLRAALAPFTTGERGYTNG